MSEAARKAALGSLERIARSARPEAWITVGSADDVMRAADAVEDSLPLAGLTLAVKDNIDVLGLPTTAAHPGLETRPERSARAVELLVEAGAVVVGKTNLDQLATGLVGTRSPYGACRNVHDPTRIAGGSSSGSAVAVALGEVDLALGTDTAGSGRVPSALNGVVGLKPTRGLVSNRGVRPACAPYDSVTTVTRSVGEGVAALAIIAGHDPEDPWSRPPPASTPVVGATLRIGVPRKGDLVGLDSHAENAWRRTMRRLEAIGEVVEIDLSPYLEAGELLYGGAFVAERWRSFGPELEAANEGADPIVAGIVGAARAVTAEEYLRDRDTLQVLRQHFQPTLDEIDVFAVPTVGIAPSHAEVAGDPIGVNSRLGRFTNGCNLLDLCAAAVPWGRRDDGIPFGVTFLGPAFADPVVALAGARLIGESDPPMPPWARWQTLVVFGAHMRGEPLDHELRALGGKYVRDVVTAGRYRLFTLGTSPAKPALVRVQDGGAAIKGELWVLPAAGLGTFVGAIPAPLGVGKVELSDGEVHSGFLGEAAALRDAFDISHHGGWRSYLASFTRPSHT